MNVQPRAAAATLAVAGLALSASPASASTMKADRAMTRLAVIVFHNVDDARRAIRSGNTVAAGNDINDALTARKDMAEIVHTDGTSMIVPLYAELDDTSALSKAVTNGHARNGSLVVRGNAVSATEVAIDLDKTKMRLDRAKTALQNNQPALARASLDAVGSDLIVLNVTTDEPLLTAREDLALARQAIASGNTHVASADLQAAARALHRYNDARHAADAHRLASDIGTQSSQASASPTFSAKLDGWWNSVTGWFSQHA